MSRKDRVQEEMRQQVSLIVQRELRNPNIGFVTITRVDVSPDLKQAKVYYTTLDTGDAFKKTTKALKSAAGYVRKCLGDRMRMKLVPVIYFRYDDAQVKVDRINEILEKIHREDEDEA